MCIVNSKQEQSQMIVSAVAYRGILSVTFNTTAHVKVTGTAYDNPSMQFSYGDKQEWLSRYIVRNFPVWCVILTVFRLVRRIRVIMIPGITPGSAWSDLSLGMCL